MVHVGDPPGGSSGCRSENDLSLTQSSEAMDEHTGQQERGHISMQIATRCQHEGSGSGSTDADAAAAAIREEASSCDKNKQRNNDAKINNSHWPAHAQKLSSEHKLTEAAKALHAKHNKGLSNSLAESKGHNIAQPDIAMPQASETNTTASEGNGPQSIACGSTTATDGSYKFKLPKSPKSVPASASMTNNQTTVVDESAQVANQNRRVPQRKASVFSYDGFPALNELDQKALKNHSMMSSSAGDLVNLSSESLMIKQQQANNEVIPPQQQIILSESGDRNGTDISASKVSKPDTSPRRSTRSDTLGSTGSSRASSCDEPTIVSPTVKSIKKTDDCNSRATQNNAQNRADGSLQTSATESSTSSLDSIDSNEATSSTQAVADQASLKHQEDSETEIQAVSRKSDECTKRTSGELVPMDVDHPKDKERRVSSASSNASSDEVFDSELDSGLIKLHTSNLPPPFESIATKVKRNSVPDANTIAQHIDKLITQNAAIIENWNQVSIRSYNSQATTSTTATFSTSCTAPIKSPRNIKSMGSGDLKNTTTNVLPQARRMNKQRWSTTALHQGSNILEQHDALRLKHCTTQVTHPNLSEHDSRKTTQDGLNLLVESRLRKRSYNTPQHNMSRIPIRQTSDASALNTLMSPRIFGSATAGDITKLSEHVMYSKPQFTFGVSSVTNNMSLPMSSPKPMIPTNTFVDIQNFMDNRFTMGGKQQMTSSQGKDLSEQPSDLNQSIESAVKNLSLKRQVEHQQQQLLLCTGAPFMQQSGEVMMATLLAERQRQQQLLEDHIYQQKQILANSQDDLSSTALLNYYQHQQQQQALENQANFNRIAALDQEFQQQMDARLLASSLQQQATNQVEQTALLMQPLDRLTERQARESQVLNEFLAKMILGREDQKHKQIQSSTLTAQQSVPIVGHNDSIDHRTSEMFTQPLDSATPSHRCDACDISFWTRDLLNYHLMTSCSARTGPDLVRPLAFNFNQPNGFDHITSPEVRHPQQASSLLATPEIQVSGLSSATKTQQNDSPNGLDMTNHKRQQSDAFQPRYANQVQKDLFQSKSVSPPRRRTYHEMEAPDHGSLQIPAKHQQAQSQLYTQQPPSSSSSSSTVFKHIQDKKQALVAPKSPHKTRESAEMAWQQRLDELCILKQQLMTSTVQQQQSSLSGELRPSNLPIKKRKISEPNMRF